MIQINTPGYVKGILKTTSAILLFIILSAGDSMGGDPFYTQFSNVPLYYNPAYTGVYTGARFRLSSRSQSRNNTPGSRAYHVSADIGDRNLPGSGGFGVIFNSDKEELGFIKNFDLGVSFSSRVQFNRNLIGQAGLRASWLQKRIAWDDIAFSEKLSENYGQLYDTGLVRHGSDVLNLPDFGIGGLIQFTTSKGSIYGTVGFAADHLFEPDQSFLETNRSPLPRKWTGHADMVISVRCPSGFNAREDDPLKINPGVIFQHQGGLSAIQAGVNLTHYGIYFGVWYKGLLDVGKSHSMSLLGGYRYVFAENMSLKLSYSYDMQVLGPDKEKRGIHEISMVLEFAGMRLFKSSNRPSYRSLTNNENFNSQLAYSGF